MEDKVQVLLSTMHLQSKKQVEQLLRKMKIQSEYLIVNQVDKTEKVEQIEHVITKQEKGLSKSRNEAVLNANANIAILADDDVIYEKNYSDIIRKAYKQNPKADVICFYVESKNEKRPTRKLKSGKIGCLKAMRISSFQITFKIDKIRKNKIVFDEDFGAGTVYDRGEEAIFLCDCLQNNLHVQYINQKIAEVEQIQSTWYKGFSPEYFRKQGAVFYRMFKKSYPFINLQFVVRKYKLYKKEVRFSKALCEIFRGSKGYKQLKKYEHNGEKKE